MQVRVTPQDALLVMQRVHKPRPALPDLVGVDLSTDRATFVLSVSESTTDPNLLVCLNCDGTWWSACDLPLNK